MLTLNSGAFSHGLPHLLVKPTLSFGTSKQVDDLLHLYGSAVDGVPRDGTWESQVDVHFPDRQVVTVMVKPETRVEDVLTLACKVVDFAVEIHF